MYIESFEHLSHSKCPRVDLQNRCTECLQALAVPIILLLASQSTRTRSASRISLTTALPPSCNSRTSRRSALSSSRLLDGREGSLNRRRGGRSLAGGNSLARSSSLAHCSSLRRSNSLSGGRSLDILLRRRRAKVRRPGVSFDMGRDLADLERRNIIRDPLDERHRRATSQLSRRRVDAVLQTRAAERRRASRTSVHNKCAYARALVSHGLRDAREHVALDECLGASVRVESVAFHVLEVVVDCVEGAGSAVLAEFGGAARDVVEVVAVEGYLVACAVLEARLS
jgi:hypothetical protein